MSSSSLLNEGFEKVLVSLGAGTSGISLDRVFDCANTQNPEFDGKDCAIGIFILKDQRFPRFKELTVQIGKDLVARR